MALSFKKDCCIGCGNCADICPVGVWEIVDGKAVMARPEDCIECGACVANCPEECITLD